MQTLHFDSPVSGLTSYAHLLAIGTENGSIYVASTKTNQIDLQFTIPSNTGITGAPVWSRDGDFIWTYVSETAYYIQPKANAIFNLITLPSSIKQIYPHPDGISVLAVLSNNTVCLVKPTNKQNFHQITIPEDDKIISVVNYQNKVNLVVDGHQPRIQTHDNLSLELQKTLEIESREESTLTFAVASEFGIVIQWADGFWKRYQTSYLSCGIACSAKDVRLVGTYFFVANGEAINIYDLKFDAILQKIDINSDLLAVFNDKIASAVDTQVHITGWKGLKSTTTRALINSTKPTERIEIHFDLKCDTELEQPKATPVELKEPDFFFKSIPDVVDCVTSNKFVPDSVRESVLEQIQDPKYDDIRDLVVFHLSLSITLEDILKYIDEKKYMVVLMMLKKLEPFNGEQIAAFITKALTILDENEVILAHFITQPHADKEIAKASLLLNCDQTDELLQFLAKMLASRRKWREFEASLSALEAAMRWSSLLIAPHLTDLAIQHKTTGLIRLREELNEENSRITAASQCWSILENVSEQKQQTIPPNFMYLVEKIKIPDFK